MSATAWFTNIYWVKYPYILTQVESNKLFLILWHIRNISCPQNFYYDHITLTLGVHRLGYVDP